MDKTKDEFALAAALEFKEENRKLRSTLRNQTTELIEARRRLSEVGRYAESEVNPPKWLQTRRRRGEHVATPTLLLTDTHFDEVVLPEQVEWINAYNRKIALQRLRRCVDNAIEVPKDYYQGLRYDGFLLLLGGDILSGTIHQELRETNEVPILQSVVYWTDQLAAAIEQLGTAFGKVHVACTYGNHGRQSKKPIAKNRAWDNYEWLMYCQLARYFDSSPNITFQIPDGADCHVGSHGVKYLLTHGDQFRGGTGIAGALSPLMLGSSRKTRRAQSAGNPYDIMVIGHWHQHIFMPSKGLIVGGCLKGYDEYAYLSNFEPEPANQAFWLTTPEHGVTFSSQIFVQDRKAEGW